MVVRGDIRVLYLRKSEKSNRGGRESCIRDGRIVERGKHWDLVRAGGTYQELYETQFSKAMETQEM